MSNELAITQQEPSVALMLQSMIERGITVDNASAMTQLMALHERMQDRDAERQFNAAFVKLQSEIPVIVASSEIPNRGKYERFEDVMRQIQPALTANGFTVSFSQSFTDNRIVETCHLKHAAGHSQQNSFGVRLGGRADSETQADCKASTTAKRNALLNALNIVVRQDCMQNEDDARIVGETVTQAQANELRERVKACGADEGAFLGYAAAKSYEDIGAGRYSDLDAMLRKKEAKKPKDEPKRDAEGNFVF